MTIFQLSIVIALYLIMGLGFNLTWGRIITETETREWSRILLWPFGILGMLAAIFFTGLLDLIYIILITIHNIKVKFWP
jgi:hypothetical protein